MRLALRQVLNAYMINEVFQTLHWPFQCEICCFENWENIVCVCLESDPMTM